MVGTDRAIGLLAIADVYDTVVTRLEGISGPTRPLDLIKFKEPNDTTLCKVMSDADVDCYSTSNLDFVPATQTEPSHANFHGTISTKLPPHRRDIVRAGYAGWATLDKKYTIFGRSFWNLDMFSHLCLRVKSDGRKYFVNIRTDSIVETDVHQHRLVTRKRGEWETVVLGLNDFVRTNGGEPINPQNEMMTSSVKSVGISVLDRIPKPFELHIAKIWATVNFENDPEFKDSPIVEQRRQIREEHFKDQKLAWPGLFGKDEKSKKNDLD